MAMPPALAAYHAKKGKKGKTLKAGAKVGKVPKAKSGGKMAKPFVPGGKK